MRFPEFSGEWESTPISTIADIIGGGTPDTSVDEYWGGNIQWFTPSEIGKEKYAYLSDRTITEAGLKNSSAKLLPQGTVLLSTRATIGECSIATAECTTNQGFQSLVAKKNNVSSEFLYYIVAKIKREMLRRSCGSTFLEISANELKKIHANIPSKAEQEKLVSLLSLIDQRIETQKKIIEDLKKLKDAIAEKLFCCPDDESPELRVENSSDRWNLYRLKDVCQRITERNSQESSSLVLTIAAQYGLVSQTDFFNKSVASENLSNYYLIRKGDFAYNKSYSGEYAWGAVKRLELYEKGVLSPLYICFRPNPLIVYSDFLSHYFETHKWHNGIAQIAGEGARNHGLLNISISDFFETIHRFPELPEQQRIASYLNSLSDKISLANKVLESYTRQKRYLLARMFI